MSDAFQDRERGFEVKFQQDQDRQFRIRARRDRLFGLWVARQLGLTDTAAATYSDSVVNSNFDAGGDETMLSKVRIDLKNAGRKVTEGELRSELVTAGVTAIREASPY